MVEAARNEQDSPAEPERKDHSGGGGTSGGVRRVLRWIWRLLLLAALVGAGYWGWQQYRQWEVARAPATGDIDRQAAYVQISAKLERQADELRALGERLAEQARRQESLHRRQERQAALLKEVLERPQSGVADDRLLPVLEADTVLRLAAGYLSTSGTVARALSLLTRADGLLAQLDDPRLTPARAALVADITALKMAKPLDQEGAYLRLGALQEAIAGLRLIPQPAREEASAAAPTPATGEQGFWSRLQANALDALRRFSTEHLRVRTLDQMPTGLLSAAAEERLRQYLELLLAQAQFALLDRQPGIYRDALDRAAARLEAQFGTDAQVAEVIREMRELRALDIAPELPNLEAARTALRGYLANVEGAAAPMGGAAVPQSETSEPAPAVDAAEAAEGVEGESLP